MKSFKLDVPLVQITKPPNKSVLQYTKCTIKLLQNPLVLQFQCVRLKLLQYLDPAIPKIMGTSLAFVVIISIQIDKQQINVLYRNSSLFIVRFYFEVVLKLPLVLKLVLVFPQIKSLLFNLVGVGWFVFVYSKLLKIQIFHFRILMKLYAIIQIKLQSNLCSDGDINVKLGGLYLIFLVNRHLVVYFFISITS
eukprot:TRINITY_DN63693_c0_g1_i1.p2 TRINITY_DN63693_c0_g1~~TRINITY_DN63693_c0_g1_i1.p2  ORF type:complete len:210 (-),score=4.61 TRINITY_DN63693_c0_g1_i1:179-757(-)